MSGQEDQLRRKLSQQAIDAWGTAFILKRRRKRAECFRKLMTLTAILIPLGIGVLAINFEEYLKEFPLTMHIAGIILAIHTVASAAIAVVFSEDKLYVTQESEAKNRNISIRSDHLMQETGLSRDVYRALAEEIIKEYRPLEEHDENRLGASSRERRRGFRAGLYRFTKKCGLCKTTPSSDGVLLIIGAKCHRCGGPKNATVHSREHYQGDKHAQP